MNPKQELFIRMIKAMGVQDEYAVSSEEAFVDGNIKDGYLAYGYEQYYRYDESFIDKNMPYFEALNIIENSDNFRSISDNIRYITNWVSFFGILTVLGIIAGIIYLIAASYA